MKRARLKVLAVAGISAIVAFTGCATRDRPATDSSAAASTPSVELPPEKPAPGDHALAFLKPDGSRQNFLLHAPPNYAAGKSYPLVLVFHGSPGSAAEMPEITKMNRVADDGGFLVAYPDWLSSTEAAAALIDHLEARWGVDEKRVHASGFSRGATFVYKLAANMPDRFGSVAPVSGIGTITGSLSRPVSLITFQGTADRLGSAFNSTNDNWAKSAGCGEEKVNTGTLGDAKAHTYSRSCAGGAQHVVYSVVGMGHAWPPDASRLIWEFFKRHPLR